MFVILRNDVCYCCSREELIPPKVLTSEKVRLRWILDSNDNIFNLCLLARTEDNVLILRSDFMVRKRVGLIGERSERDTLKGNTIENRGYLFVYICVDIRMPFCTLTLPYFLFARCSTPSQTSLNRILWFSDHYPYHPRN